MRSAANIPSANLTTLVILTCGQVKRGRVLWDMPETTTRYGVLLNNDAEDI